MPKFYKKSQVRCTRVGSRSMTTTTDSEANTLNAAKVSKWKSDGPKSCVLSSLLLFVQSIFTAPCIAMERSWDRMTYVSLYVCLSVTLVDCDHIRWARWNFITRLISAMSSLAVRKISAIWCKGNFFKFAVEQRWGMESWRFSTDKSSYLRNGER